MLGRTRRIHFVGIGGIGMSGIAELLVNQGYDVTGSDLKASNVTTHLGAVGVRVYDGHAAEHVDEADVVVVSSAVKPSNVEVTEARRRQIPVIPRAEMLAELMRLRFGIAVGGAHGKTSTTSMIALMLERAGLDPTAVIGGRLSVFGSNARLGRGHYMVAEADESDGSFLKLSPSIAVITNVDREHLEHYGTFDALLDAFVDFANKVPFYGVSVLCADDAQLASLRGRISRRVITYGIDQRDADLVAEDIHLDGAGARCVVHHRPGRAGKGRLGELRLAVPGRHNLLNALAATAVGLELGVSFERIAEALSQFQGAERRFERCGGVSGVAVVDDYGHHPTEISAVIAAARSITDGRVIVAFQPHRYTRTKLLLEDFGRTLAAADVVVLTDIYPAGEDAIPGVTIEAVADAVRRAESASVSVVPALSDVAPAVARLTRPGDLVITLGAGSIGGVARQILRELREVGDRP